MKFSLKSKETGIGKLLLFFFSIIIFINAIADFIFNKNYVNLIVYLLLATILYLISRIPPNIYQIDIDLDKINYLHNNKTVSSINWKDLNTINYGLGAEHFVISFYDSNNKNLLQLTDMRFTRNQLREICQQLHRFKPEKVNIDNHNIYLDLGL